MSAHDGVGLATRVDLAFPVQGQPLPRDHRLLLSRALAATLPWLGIEPGTGAHDLNVVAGLGARGLLSGRTRLTLRVPRERAGAVSADLAGLQIELGGEPLRLGAPTLRELLPHRTLYAHFVAASSDDETSFMANIDAELGKLGVSSRPICGRCQQIQGEDGPLTGFSLMLDGLSAPDALQVLEVGLGPHRRLGCGLFVPHKSAGAVGA